MATSNGIPGQHQPACQATDQEIAARLAIVSAAKARVGRDLTDAELDLLLEPTPCLRTRTRLAKGVGLSGVALATGFSRGVSHVASREQHGLVRVRHQAMPARAGPGTSQHDVADLTQPDLVRPALPLAEWVGLADVALQVLALEAGGVAGEQSAADRLVGLTSPHAELLAWA